MNKQKPVIYVAIDDSGFISYGQLEPREDLTPLYTHPAIWQSLSDDEMKIIQNNSWIINSDGSKEFNTFVFARAIEQALKEKNHA